MTTTKYWMIDTTGEFGDELVEVIIPDPFESDDDEQQPLTPPKQGDQDAKLV